MNELIKAGDSITIKDNDIKVIEYKGHRVLSSYAIARLHGKEVKRVNEQFERNKTRLQEGVDYFLIDREEFEVAESDHKISNKARHQFERLFTEKGYLKLVKSFTDDLSWEVQDLLVDSYFKLKEALQPKEQCFLEILRSDDEIDRVLAIRKLDQTVIKPLEHKVESLSTEVQEKTVVIGEQAETIEKAKPKVDFYDTVTMSSETIDLADAAKLLNFKGVGRNNLYRLLRQWKVIDSDNRPYQKYVNIGCFKLVQYTVPGPYGRTQIKFKTVCYQKGLDLLLRVLTKKGYQRHIHQD